MIPLVYAVHSANLFGTERMALETLYGFRDTYTPILLCPSGPLEQEARNRGIDVRVCNGSLALFRVISSILRVHKKLVFMSTTAKQVLFLSLANLLKQRTVSHLHLVHGGASEKLSYGRKKYLRFFKLFQVGVSPFVKERLIAHGVPESQIRVVGNFLTEARRKSITRRAAFEQEPPRKGLVISRMIPAKRVNLLLEALEKDKQLEHLAFTCYGTGGQLEPLRHRAESGGLNVTLPGFSSELNRLSAGYDFLVHLCPDEPFGLVILEAMAAGLPVLVPDTGGVTFIVQDRVNGFTFEANDASALAEGIHRLINTPLDELNQIVARSSGDLETRFACEGQLACYQEVIEEAFTR